MSFSTYLSYRMIKINVDNSKAEFFIKLCQEERDIRKETEEYISKSKKEKRLKNKEELIKKADRIKFDFYEHLAILLDTGNIYEDIFFDYFGKYLFGETYVDFMFSPIFIDWEDKIFDYPNLSRLFNSFELSIKEIPKEWEEY